MTTVAIRPASVPEVFHTSGRVTANWPVANASTTSLVQGELCVLTGGELAPVALSNGLVTNANTIAAVTNEPFRSSLYAAGSVPIRQLTVGVSLLMPDTVIEMNYYDVVNTPNHRVTRSLVGTSLAVFKSGEIYYARYLTSYTNLATFVVVDLVSPVGSIYGRILVKPAASFRLY